MDSYQAIDDEITSNHYSTRPNPLLRFMTSFMLSPLEYCLELHRNNRLPHALIFSAGDLTHMEKTGRLLSQFLLCEQPKSHMACGICHNCQLFQAESHPDFFSLFGEGKTRTIKIDAVRALTEFLHQTASISHYRVVLILNAQDLNTAASNALLKSLEEPGDNTLLILITHDEHLLLPTLRSRAQVIHFKNPEFQISLPDLIQALKAPSFNPLALAQQFHAEPLLLTETLHYAMQDQIKQTLGLATNPNTQTKINLPQAFKFCQTCAERKKALLQKSPLNGLLLAEELFIAYQQVFS